MVINNSEYKSNYKGAFNSTGVIDWIIQRKTAVFMAVYIFILTWFFYNNNPVEYINWANLFNNLYFKIFTGLFLISLLSHAWIGVWIIATDYISNSKLRILFLGICKLLFTIYLVWGVYILI